jgi:Uma2 family endonuclease
MEYWCRISIIVGIKTGMAMLMNKPKTMVDVYRLLPEGTPIQVINNQFYMCPSPNFFHFDTVDKIVDALKAGTKEQGSGRIFFAPMDVYLGDRNAVQPDVFFVSKAHENYIREDGIYGAPDLIVEILSPQNKNADLVKKKAIYEQFGVQEYFIVEPMDKSVITYYLKENKYVEQKKQKGKLVSKVLNKTFPF